MLVKSFCALLFGVILVSAQERNLHEKTSSKICRSIKNNMTIPVEVTMVPHYPFYTGTDYDEKDTFLQAYIRTLQPGEEDDFSIYYDKDKLDGWPYVQAKIVFSSSEGLNDWNYSFYLKYSECKVGLIEKDLNLNLDLEWGQPNYKKFDLLCSRINL